MAFYHLNFKNVPSAWAEGPSLSPLCIPYLWVTIAYGMGWQWSTCQEADAMALPHGAEPLLIAIVACPHWKSGGKRPAWARLRAEPWFYLPHCFPQENQWFGAQLEQTVIGFSTDCRLCWFITKEEVFPGESGEEKAKPLWPVPRKPRASRKPLFRHRTTGSVDKP